MDDFRVGSVPLTDPYGSRELSGSNQRKRQKRRDSETGEPEDESFDTFVLQESGDEPIQDTYTPSEPESEP